MHKAPTSKRVAPATKSIKKTVSKKAVKNTSATKTTTRSITSSPKSTPFKSTITTKNKTVFNTQRRKFSSLPSHEILTMPALSPTMEQGTVASWEKKIGDKISPGDAICQVTTDKATVAFEATDEGYLAQILVQAGDDIIEVGKPVAVVVEEESDVAAFKDFKIGGTAKTPVASKLDEPAPKKVEKDISEQRSCGVYIAPESPAAVNFKQTGDRVAASPLARVTAKNLGVELSEISGTGMFGSITQANVLSHKPAPKPAASQPATDAKSVEAQKRAVVDIAPTGDYVDQPLSNMRKVIAQRLTQSKQTIPHYYITVEVEMDQINNLRNDFNKQLAAAAGKDEKPTKLSVNDFIIKASAAALNKVPEVNSSWQDTAIRRYNYVDISVAVSTDAGLITPIIADADLKGLAGISTEMKSLAGKARTGKLVPAEYQGGTFTISNLGMFGVDQFSAIINPPQAAILAIGGTSTKVLPNPKYDPSNPTSQQFKAVSVMKVTASFDHRVVDGAVGAQFLSEFKQFCENPTKLLL